MKHQKHPLALAHKHICYGAFGATYRKLADNAQADWLNFRQYSLARCCYIYTTHTQNMGG